MQFVKLAGRLLTFKSIMHGSPPKIDWVVEPLVAVGNRVVFYGEFGCLKSWLLLDLAVHLAAGRPWLGKFPISGPRRTLYIDEEMSDAEERRRLKRLARAAGLADEDLPFRIVSHAGVRFSVPVLKDVLQQLDQKRFDPEVVIIETFRRVLQGSENEARDVAEFWRQASEYFPDDKVLIISHHMKKPNPQGRNESRYQASGSTDILAGADCGFAIKRLAGNIISVECVKSRVAEEPTPFLVGVSFGEDETSPVSLEYEGSRDDAPAVQSKLEHANSLLHVFFRQDPDQTRRTKEIIDYLVSQGVKEHTAERALLECGKTGLLRKISHGVWQLREGQDWG